MAAVCVFFAGAAIALLQTVLEMRSAARFIALSARCLLWVALVLSVPTSALSADKKVPERTMLIMNVKIFDGTPEKHITGKDVTIKGNKIDKLVDAGGDGSVYDRVIDGNPLEVIKVVGELKNLRVIMNDGKIYKNTL